MDKLTKEEVLKKTEELLNQPNLNFDYITQELVSSDNEQNHLDGSLIEGSENEKTLNSILFGNNVRYGTRTINGRNWQVYYYDYGGSAPTSNRNLACGSGRLPFWLLMQDWDHTFLGNCSNGRELWRFDKK
jgi:hypothetical protein